jgi:hypothetical protein
MRPDSTVISVPALFMCVEQQPSEGALSRLQVALLLQALAALEDGTTRTFRGYLLCQFSHNGNITYIDGCMSFQITT